MPGLRFKFEVARQASSPSLCASVQARPWAAEAEQQLSRLAPSGYELSGDFRLFRAGLLEASSRARPKICLKFEVAIQASSTSLCASVRAVPWADEAKQQLSRLAPCGSSYLKTFTFSEQCCWRRPAGTYPILGLRLKFEVAGQASSPSLCASVRAGPWADEAEEQLSRLAPSGCLLSADVHIFGAGLRKEPGR